MLETLKANDWAIIFATLAGPILAVQAQKWIERASDRTQKKYGLFSTLMITRGTQLAPEHVAALNSIDLIFEPSRVPWARGRDAAVIEAWRLYLQQLNTPFNKDSEAEFYAWNAKKQDLFIELLMKMATAVGFKAERERVRGVYQPTGHFELELDQRKFIANAARVLAGEQALKMSVVELPASPEAIKLHEQLQKGILNVVSGGSIAVRIEPESRADLSDSLAAE